MSGSGSPHSEARQLLLESHTEFVSLSDSPQASGEQQQRLDSHREFVSVPGAPAPAAGPPVEAAAPQRETQRRIRARHEHFVNLRRLRQRTVSVRSTAQNDPVHGGFNSSLFWMTKESISCMFPGLIVCF